MQVELRMSEVLRVSPDADFLSMNPQQRKQVAIKVLRRRSNDASNFVADQILRGNPGFEFVIADDVSHLT